MMTELSGSTIPLRELQDNIKGQTKLCKKRWLTHGPWKMAEKGNKRTWPCCSSPSPFLQPQVRVVICCTKSIYDRLQSEIIYIGENPSFRHPHTYPQFNTKGSFPPHAGDEVLNDLRTHINSCPAFPVHVHTTTHSFFLWKGTVLLGELF